MNDFRSAILNFARHALFLQVGHEVLELFDLSFYSVGNKDSDTIYHGVCIWHHDLRVRPDHLKISRTRHFIFQKQTKKTNKKKKNQTSKQKRHYFETSAGISQLMNSAWAMLCLLPHRARLYRDVKWAITELLRRWDGSGSFRIRKEGSLLHSDERRNAELPWFERNTHWLLAVEFSYIQRLHKLYFWRISPRNLVLCGLHTDA